MSTRILEHPETARLLDVRAVARRLTCSTRHVHRLTALGAMPAPVRLGASVRWSARQLDDWIARGCPACRQDKKTRGDQ
jgi:predicted DNA-binding transcriptional regulator AlpA